MSEQITLLEITTIGTEGVGFKFHGLKHFNNKWFSWAAISKAVLHREDEVFISPDCDMPAYVQLSAKCAEQEKTIADLQKEVDRLNKWADGFSDAQLKERQTGEMYQRELRDTIAQLEARIKASQGQKPAGLFVYCELYADKHKSYVQANEAEINSGMAKPLYAAPIPEEK